MKNFTKNDNGFVCEHCGKQVQPLGYTSRNHCPYCLYSLHVDIMPGDRANTCHGLQQPISIDTSSKKGYIITYKCLKCGQITHNKAANDDNFDTMLSIQQDYSRYKK